MDKKEEKNEKSTINLLAVLFAFMIGLTVGSIDNESLEVLKDRLFYKEGTSLVSRPTHHNEQDFSLIYSDSTFASSDTQASSSDAVQAKPSSAATLPAELTTTSPSTVTTTEPTSVTVVSPIQTTIDSATFSTSSQVKTTAQKQTESKVPFDGGDYLTIYRTPTGKRYHFSPTCAGDNKIETNLDEAQELGLTPCKKCAGG